MKPSIEVIKLNAKGNLVWSYRGSLLAESPNSRVIEAYFDRGPIDLGLLQLQPKDRMVEHFYSDRWYNIFEVYRQDGQLVGWYCNIARPAEFSSDSIRQVDLALDLIVDPTGKTEVMDQAEFEQLNLSSQDKKMAFAALARLQNLVAARAGMFKRLAPPAKKQPPS